MKIHVPHLFQDFHKDLVKGLVACLLTLALTLVVHTRLDLVVKVFLAKAKRFESWLWAHSLLLLEHRLRLTLTLASWLGKPLKSSSVLRTIRMEITALRKVVIWRHIILFNVIVVINVSSFRIGHPALPILGSALLRKSKSYIATLVANGRLIVGFFIRIRQLNVDHWIIKCVAVATSVWLKLWIGNRDWARCVEALWYWLRVERFGIFVAISALGAHCRRGKWPTALTSWSKPFFRQKCRPLAPLLVSKFFVPLRFLAVLVLATPKLFYSFLIGAKDDALVNRLSI